MLNIKLTIAYDGTAYLGWQKTKEGPSIEAEIQKSLEQILQHSVDLQATSRTDAGVHAMQQAVNFITPKKSLNLRSLARGLNALLPKDITVLEVEAMPASYHPTLDCQGKEYHYYICYGNTQKPFHRLYSWHYASALNIDLMRRGAEVFIGEHDFSSFCNFRKTLHYEHGIRRIDEIHIEEVEEARLCIRVKGNHFLYKMVRNLVGTLVYIGCRKIDIAELPLILRSHDRQRAGVTAPPHGLFLHQLFF